MKIISVQLELRNLEVAFAGIKLEKCIQDSIKPITSSLLIQFQEVLYLHSV